MVNGSIEARPESGVSEWLRRVLIAAGLLLALSAPAVAAPWATDPRLSATLVGRLERGEPCRLAVRWDGPPGQLLDVWVDLDGDGQPSPQELVVEGRPLAPGIEVVTFDLEPGARVVAEPKLWVRARAGGSSRVGEAAATDACATDRGACAWQPGFALADLDGIAYAMTVFDDGTGPALIVGGAFTSANDVIVNHIARWDGDAWSALSGPFVAGMSGNVYALEVFDDGTGAALYAGGDFIYAGGTKVDSIGRWDGSTWSALGGPSGTGTTGWVYALETYDHGGGPALYVGGDFEIAGGVVVNRVARWDGSVWSGLGGPSGTGLNDRVYALEVFDDGSGPALHAGGIFTTAGGVSVNRVARWDGSAWSGLSGPSGLGVDNAVVALMVYDDGGGPALYVGGAFAVAGGVTANGIARWDGVLWTPLNGPSGTGVSGTVLALAVYDDGGGSALYAGGDFPTAGGGTVNRVARWNGSTWSVLSGPSGTGVNSALLALAVYDDGTGPALYAGGWFTTAGGVMANRVASWRGTAWFALSTASGGGVNDAVSALVVAPDDPGPALYAGGWFTTAGGVSVNRIARWDGSSWSALTGPSATGADDIVAALAVFDQGTGPALYAGGWFTTAGGVTANRIARWDGTAWSALAGPAGTGVDGAVLALAVFDDGTGPALYAGGDFTTAGGVTVNHIARWDGSAWSALGGPSGIGVDLWVDALAVVDDGTGAALYAGGDFATAGGVVVNRIARWDGTAWSALNGVHETGVNAYVDALAVVDDGVGPTLVVGGAFTTAGGVPVNKVARWNGTAWLALTGPSDTGTNSLVSALAVYDDGSGPELHAGGWFTTAGGLPSSHIAAWRCPSAVIFTDGFEDGGIAAWSLTVP